MSLWLYNCRVIESDANFSMINVMQAGSNDKGLKLRESSDLKMKIVRWARY
jgi:hypothetical protein